MADAAFPSGTIRSPKDLGQLVRASRKAHGLRQAEAAALCNVGTRFLSELEGGKPTVELAKVLEVLQGLGLELSVTPREGGG